ncbi:MAG: AAA domain-containing protein [Bacteroidaceae bacterium]
MLSLRQEYQRVYKQLEQFCFFVVKEENIPFNSLKRVLFFICSHTTGAACLQPDLFRFCQHATAVMNEVEEPQLSLFSTEIAAITALFSLYPAYGQSSVVLSPSFAEKISHHSSEALSVEEAPVEETPLCCDEQNSTPHFYKCLSALFLGWEGAFLSVLVDEIATTPLRVSCALLHKHFSASLKVLWPEAQLHLLAVSIDDEGVLLPKMISIEPGYLFDISSLAECFKAYGAVPENYILDRWQQRDNTVPMLIGNFANLFLDEWIHATGEVDYRESMKKAFKKYYLDLSTCADLQNKQIEKQFFQSCALHFQHIRTIVKEGIPTSGYIFDLNDAVLEPSYVCEALGIQGRLDYMQRDRSAFIEMKSGKADEYSQRGSYHPQENNYVQMLLYMAVLEYSMDYPSEKQHPFLLYTRYPWLYKAHVSWDLVEKALDVRNQVVAFEYRIQLQNSAAYTQQLFEQMHPDFLNINKLQSRLWTGYQRPALAAFFGEIQHLSALAKKYVFALYTFITKELYLCKLSSGYHVASKGTSLWSTTFDQKCNEGELLYDLAITENRAADAHHAFIRLSLPAYPADFLPNFRSGDIVVLYERNGVGDYPGNKMIFKGSLESISSKEIVVRLRATQCNTDVLPLSSKYALEHDFVDIAYLSMFKGLHTFMKATKRRSDLLLGLRAPEHSTRYANEIENAENDFDRIKYKALAANDYFLLVGPPGTGKTSQALRRMVEVHLEQPNASILLLSYTNRAVDEICKSLESIEPAVHYLRLGNELTCGAPYKSKLLDTVMEPFSTREDIKKAITSCSVFVGTVAYLSNKSKLFQLKKFDVAIIDEATQILEPQLLGLLCAKDAVGEDAIRKFIMIGDYKQLPAVVLQKRADAEVTSKALIARGFSNLSDSLFERLYRQALSQKWDQVYDRLCLQGRMHPEVASFANKFFYGSTLLPVGLPHQEEESVVPTPNISGAWANLLSLRSAFIATKAEPFSVSMKNNEEEALFAAHLVLAYYQNNPTTFNAATSIGVITPYRSQIALIKQKIALFNLPILQDIAVDTVERFQGSERDVIVYSFSVNFSWQLDMLSTCIEDQGQPIDRKLNVALTRARKQLFLVGDVSLLNKNLLFSTLIHSFKVIKASDFCLK